MLRLVKLSFYPVILVVTAQIQLPGEQIRHYQRIAMDNHLRFLFGSTVVVLVRNSVGQPFEKPAFLLLYILRHHRIDLGCPFHTNGRRLRLGLFVLDLLTALYREGKKAVDQDLHPDKFRIAFPLALN
ncbi:hypothetical protein D3C87_1488200 [compost metagenome]